MGDAIGQIVVLGVAVALSPMAIIGVVLMLATPRGRTNGPAFIAGWVVGLAVLGALVLVISGGADASESGSPATWVSVLKLVLGLGLIGLGVKHWRGRPKSAADAHLPTWMKTVDRFTAPRAVSLGVGLSAINPKNLVLTVAAATAIAQTGASTGDQIGALLVFVIIGTLGPAIPVAIYFLMGNRAKAILDDLHDWMTRNNDAIMAVVLLLIGAKLIGDAISALA
jgi:threonine/homoserine/homoserine lactone efflux protein